MKKFTKAFIAIVLAISIFPCIAQTINIHSIDDSRMLAGDYGYTLNGMHMTFSAAKLTDTANFSITGTYPKNVTITNGYSTSGSLESISGVSNIDLFFFGSFNKNNFWLYQFTDAELDSLYNWSVNGGKMIIGGVAVAPQFDLQPDILNSRWNFDIAVTSQTGIFPTPSGDSSSIFNGPFGSITSALQGGTIQGYFNLIPADAVVLGDDGAGNPTLILDCKTLDLIVSDCDAFTELGNISYSSSIFTNNDILWANAIAFMDSLQSPPVISKSWNTLYTGNYSSYQWYLNGAIIPGATSNSYIATQSGLYSVEVALDCGCSNVASQEVFVTVGVNEISNASNITIGPNPIKNGNLNFSGINEPVNVSIINSVGVITDVVHLDHQITSVNTEKLSPGVYTVYIEDKKGTLLMVKKLIKE